VAPRNRVTATLLGVRRLIVNADDLGLTHGVNRAIHESHTGGVVSSATLMAGGAAFDHAVQIIRSTPTLSAGCHVVLVDGTPLLDRASVPSLLSNSSPNRGFHSGIQSFAVQAVMGKFDREQLVDEIVAQVKKIRSAGIQVTHFDTHKHTHMFPIVLEAMAAAALICGVPAIRNPFVPSAALRVSRYAGEPSLWKRYGQVRMLRHFGRQFRERMRRAGLSTPDGSIGVVETGSLNSSLLQRSLEDLPDGTWELVCHPGYDDSDLRAARTRLLGSRDQERQLLMSRDLREFLERHKIRVIGYREFAAGR
jgi:hopanoid biosynthesis associated protein HpnK